MALPIVLIIDDATPLLNLYWWHAAERQNTDAPVQESGERVAKHVAREFLNQFINVLWTHGIRGKFSVVPYPAGLGKISRGLPGVDREDLRRWVRLVREMVAPLMDITPEMITHTKAVNLRGMTLLPQTEAEWSKKQDEATLTTYIAAALRFLAEAQLEATGVTSPWDFGTGVERDYRRAILAAVTEHSGRSQAWYFLETEPEATEFRSRIVLRRGAEWLVSIVSQCKDYMWETMETTERTPQYARAIADKYMTEDGSGGRLAELFSTGTPIVFHTHWQSLYSNGRRTGLGVLHEIGRRVKSAWGDKVQWTKCSELAAQIAQGLWATSQMDPEVASQDQPAG